VSRLNRAADHTAGEFHGRLPFIHDESSVQQHIIDALRVLVRVGERAQVPDRGCIEDDNVGKRALTQPAAVSESCDCGWQGRR
jgi:hypothetical protein